MRYHPSYPIMFSACLLLLLVLAAAGCTPVVDAGAGPIGADTEPRPSAADIYDALAPSVAFIETPAGTGSGLLAELDGERYVITNAHVVWPFSEVRVVFPNGEEHLLMPVRADDQLVDLALVGPLQTDLPTVDLDVHGELRTGEPVYLIGYPGEGELFPVPAITEGILSRTRTWEIPESLRYYQTDAAGAGGQSGGILVSSQGDVIGFSGMLFYEAFVLAASSTDLVQRLDQMLASANTDATFDADTTMGNDSTSGESPATQRRRFREELENLWDTDGYFAYAPIGERIEVSATSDGDLGVSLFDAGPAEITYADSSFAGTETVSATITLDAPQVVVVEQFLPGNAAYQLRSSHPMAPIPDGEDGQEVAVGLATTGVLDYPSDIDWFVLPLASGEEVLIRLEAADIDPLLSVGPLGESGEEYAEDDDSGRGMLGSNAALLFQANQSGDHLVVVRSFASEDVGGYILSIEPSQ